MKMWPSIALVLQRNDRCLNTHTIFPLGIRKPAPHMGPCHIARRLAGPSSLVISKGAKHMPLTKGGDPLAPGCFQRKVVCHEPSAVAPPDVEGTRVPSRMCGTRASRSCRHRVSEVDGHHQ